MRNPIENRGDTALEPVLKQILRNAIRALGGSAAVAATWDEIAKRYVVSASYGVDQAGLERLRPFLDEAIPDLVESREHFDLLSQMAPHRLLPVSQHGQMQDPIMALPLHVGGNTIGLIYVLRPEEAALFSELDPPVLAAFADQAAVALQNARLAQLLAQEKRRVESVLEGSADGIYTVDSQRRIVTLNPAMERLLGRPKEDLIGQPCFQALDLRDSEGYALCPTWCPMLTSVGNDQGVFELEGRLSSQDGVKTDVSVVYSIVRSLEGHPVNAVVNVRDITAVREMESLRSVFLSMLGHQLQTPLQIIKGYASTLARTEGQWDESILRQSVEAIEEEADRLSLLVNRLLLASRLESGEFALRREPVHFGALAQRVVRRARGMSSEHRFRVSFPADLPPVTGDPELLEEVLVNLVDNAVKYSPDGGTVTVAGGTPGDYLELSVADQGIGIPRWDFSRIFNRFQRGENRWNELTRGVGLGLYICNAIIAAHGGRIEVQSQPGEGSKFTIILPVPEEQHDQLG